MVYFTCNNCGESLKKASVEKHYFGRCRYPKFLTCIDCMKDFRGEEYDGHTKCISENEKYSAKGFSSPSPSVKGQAKQLSWLELIQYVSKNHTHVPVEQASLLHKLCSHDNVPQKRAKFQNFVKSISYRTHQAVVDQVWDLLETEKCARKEKEDKKDDGNSVNEDKMENGSAQNKHAEGELSEHDAKRQKKRKAQEVASSEMDPESENNVTSKEPDLNVKKKKKKRDKIDSDIPVNNDDLANGVKSDVSSMKQSKSKNKSKHEEKLTFCDDTSVLKKMKLAGENEESVLEEVKSRKFNWCKTIVKVLESADDNELSVKRLRKKVVSEFSSCTGAEVDDSVFAKFTKKLTKLPVVILLKDKAKLKKQK